MTYSSDKNLIKEEDKISEKEWLDTAKKDHSNGKEKFVRGDLSKALLKRKLPVFLLWLNINIIGLFRCLDPTHEDVNASAFLKKGGEKIFCRGCSSDYDLFDLIGFIIGTKDYKVEWNWAVRHLVQNGENYVIESTHNSYSNACVPKSNIELTSSEGAPYRAYFEDRGILLTLALEYKAFGKFDAQGNRYVCIPCGNQYIVKRNIDPKAAFRYKNEVGVQVECFNSNAISNAKSDEPIFVCEGVFDALSLVSYNLKAVSINSVNGSGRFIQHLKDTPKKSCMFILCFDNDFSGKKCGEDVQIELKKLGYKSKCSSLLGSYHDINERFCLDNAALWDDICTYLV